MYFSFLLHILRFRPRRPRPRSERSGISDNSSMSSSSDKGQTGNKHLWAGGGGETRVVEEDYLDEDDFGYLDDLVYQEASVPLTITMSVIALYILFGE